MTARRDADESADHPPRADLVPLLAAHAQQHVGAASRVHRRWPTTA